MPGGRRPAYPYIELHAVDKVLETGGVDDVTVILTYCKNAVLVVDEFPRTPSPKESEGFQMSLDTHVHASVSEDVAEFVFEDLKDWNALFLLGIALSKQFANAESGKK